MTQSCGRHVPDCLNGRARGGHYVIRCRHPAAESEATHTTLDRKPKPSFSAKLQMSLPSRLSLFISLYLPNPSFSPSPFPVPSRLSAPLPSHLHPHAKTHWLYAPSQPDNHLVSPPEVNTNDGVRTCRTAMSSNRDGQLSPCSQSDRGAWRCREKTLWTP